MDFVSTRIITDDLDGMIRFYEQVTGSPAARLAPVFAEVRLATGTLALGHSSTTPLFNDAAVPAQNRTAIEFLVDDVDGHFERLKPHVTDWVQEPTTMPWGNRSMLFRDPDGNLVNLFAPVTKEAIDRFQTA